VGLLGEDLKISGEGISMNVSAFTLQSKATHLNRGIFVDGDGPGRNKELLDVTVGLDDRNDT
jgi:hypothetical protein